MKNEFFLMVDTEKKQRVMVLNEKNEPREFRSEGQANSEGRRMVNANAASKYRILKTISEQE